MKNKSNIFHANPPYFEDFTKTSLYSKLRKQIQADLEVFTMTANCYYNEMKDFTEEILTEANLE